LPVLDDWTYLQQFSEARAAGPGPFLDCLRRLIDNTDTGQFRLNWAGFLPALALAFPAGTSAWPYTLLFWVLHLATALALNRLVATLTGHPETAFAAGAIYVVFPACNDALFRSFSTIYYLAQPLGLLWWLHGAWRDRFRWSLAAAGRLSLVAFLGEQIIPVLALLPGITWLLFGRRQEGGQFLRRWAAHLATLAALAGFYALVINMRPILASARGRYGAVDWHPWRFVSRMLGALHVPGLAEWEISWTFDATPGLLAAPAAAAVLWGLRRYSRPSPDAASSLKLIAWAAAATALAWLPVAGLAMEYRYLYVPSTFVAAGLAATLTTLPAPQRRALVALAVAATAALGWFEMQACWIPQSRLARAALQSVDQAAPWRDGDIAVFAGGPFGIGSAPNFITGSSWSLKSMLELRTGRKNMRGGRDVWIDERGDWILSRPDSSERLVPPDHQRLRIFAYDPATGRYHPQPLSGVRHGHSTR